MTLKYSIVYHKRVRRALRKLPEKDALIIIKKIGDVLRENPYAGKALKGKYRGLYSLRIGNFRVIYQIDGDESKVLVLKVGEREGVYDNLYF